VDILDGVEDSEWDHRAPSTPGLGSSVTSYRRCAQPLSAEASWAPVPGWPTHDNSARNIPGAAGCGVHSRSVRLSTTDPMAHSTCGHKAVGAECTNRTPRVVATDIPSSIAVGTSSPTTSAWTTSLTYAVNPAGYSVIWRRPNPDGRRYYEPVFHNGIALLDCGTRVRCGKRGTLNLKLKVPQWCFHFAVHVTFPPVQHLPGARPSGALAGNCCAVFPRRHVCRSG
jgi:hypothetical protein